MLCDQDEAHNLGMSAGVRSEWTRAVLALTCWIFNWDMSKK